MNGSTIRDMAPEEAPAVGALILEGLAGHWGSIDPNLNPDLDDMAATYSHGRTVVVVSGEGVVVGTGTLVPRADSGAEIIRMSVAPVQQGSGLGRAIVEELVRTAHHWGCSHVVLETTSAWEAVVAFYLRCGFVITHTNESPFGEDTWFRLDLTP